MLTSELLERVGGKFCCDGIGETEGGACLKAQFAPLLQLPLRKK